MAEINPVVKSATISLKPIAQNPSVISPSNPPDVDKLENKKHAGQPCKFCTDKENVMKITKEYLTECQSTTKPRVPFINELALKIGIHRDTMHLWRNPLSKQCKANHDQFSDIVKYLETMQEWRLQQGLMGRYNPTGRIFLLKTKHGYIESEKQIIAGDKNEPLEITITEEKHALDE